MVTVPPEALSGFIQKTEPSVTVSALLSVQVSQSMPMLPRAPAESPPVMPTVSHESKAAVGATRMNAGLTPPVLAPKGVASWYAAGKDNGRATLPQMAYMLDAAGLRMAES